MRVQITGAGGLLGSQVWRAFAAAGYETFLSSFDISEVHRSEIIAPLVVNCAGIVKQRADVPASRFAKVNAYGPHRLADACDDRGARLVHISTDCVFGELSGPHDESAMPVPEDLYAATKLAGEITRDPHLTIRTSFVGPGARGLWAAVARGEFQRASGKYVWSGHCTWVLADLVVELAMSKASGLLHIPGVPIDRWSLVNAIALSLGVDLVVQRDDAYARDRRLESRRYDSLGFRRLPSFQEQLLTNPEPGKHTGRNRR